MENPSRLGRIRRKRVSRIQLIIEDLREAYFYLSDLPDQEASVHAKGVDLAHGFLLEVSAHAKYLRTLEDSAEEFKKLREKFAPVDSKELEGKG